MSERPPAGVGDGQGAPTPRPDQPQRQQPDPFIPQKAARGNGSAVEIAATKPACSNCLYWAAPQQPDEIAGSCRRLSPRASGWPKAAASDWCGRWQVALPQELLGLARQLNNAEAAALAAAPWVWRDVELLRYSSFDLDQLDVWDEDAEGWSGPRFPARRLAVGRFDLGWCVTDHGNVVEACGGLVEALERARELAETELARRRTVSAT
jgi:hypothetical protein